MAQQLWNTLYNTIVFICMCLLAPNQGQRSDSSNVTKDFEPKQDSILNHTHWSKQNITLFNKSKAYFSEQQLTTRLRLAKTKTTILFVYYTCNPDRNVQEALRTCIMLAQLCGKRLWNVRNRSCVKRLDSIICTFKQTNSINYSKKLSYSKY